MSFNSRPARRWVIPPLFITESSSFAFASTAGLRLQLAAICVISCDHIALEFWFTLFCSSYASSPIAMPTLPQASASLLNRMQISQTSWIRVFCSAEQRVTSHFQKGALGRCSCTARRFSASDRAATLRIEHSRRAYAASGPSALLMTTMSACSMMPFFSPCSSSPMAGGIRSITISTMSSIITSDWPSPTVSTMTMS